MRVQQAAISRILVPLDALSVAQVGILLRLAQALATGATSVLTATLDPTRRDQQAVQTAQEAMFSRMQLHLTLPAALFRARQVSTALQAIKEAALTAAVDITQSAVLAATARQRVLGVQ
jgi:hypothetical protein